MERVADGVYILDGFPKYGINIYLIEDVLLDAGTRWATGRILRELKNKDVSAHALTHAHPDHQGASRAICTRLNLPLWCGANDADAMESGDFSTTLPVNWNTRLQHMIWTGPSHPVETRLHEGDEVAGFTVVDVPGHSPGQVAYWRESDRLLILGDVLNGIHLLTSKVGLHEPPLLFTVDAAQNRNSARKLAQLEPETVCFGHGPPWRDGNSFQDFVSALAT
jgi:hydroxyacylglutathione hydrolase